MPKAPPRLADKVLAMFLKEHLMEEVLGDLEEKYYSICQKRSVRRARLNYWFQVLHYLRPFAIKSHQSSKILVMNRHNFVIGYRILLRNKLYSLLNIGGLALGMTVAILIGLWIADDLSFNTHHRHYDRVVQVLRKNIYKGNVNGSLVSKLGEYLRQNYSAHFDAVAMTFFRNGEELLTKGKNTFSERGYYFESQIGEILTPTMISGSYKDLKKEDLLISASLAKKFFGDEDAVGKILKLNAKNELIVRGVYADFPGNSTFHDAQFFASMDLIYNEENPRTWDNFNTRVFALLKEETNAATASAAITDILQTQTTAKEEVLFVHPMSDWHLYSTFKNGQQALSPRLQFIILTGIIGVFVLILACINFMNLNTARYQSRSKEVGVRKAIGSMKYQLVYQFLTETMLYAAAALFIAVICASLLLPWFGTLAGRDFVFPWSSLTFWCMCVGFTGISGLFAGSYPAFLLSSFHPVAALKGVQRQGKFNIRLRQALVVFQFTVSIALIIGTVAVHNQLQTIKNRPVGYDQERIITIRARTNEYMEKFDLFTAELKRKGLVTEAATANYPLTTTLGNNNTFSFEDRPIDLTFNTIFVTDDYGKTVGWELIDGQDFSKDITDESGSIILSELGVKQMGLEDPVGTTIYSSSAFNDKTQFRVIGVVKDMIKGSPASHPVPLMIFNTPFTMPWTFLKIDPQIPIAEAIAEIQETLYSIDPQHPFAYRFLEEEYAEKFREEERIGNMVTLSSVLAILVSCLGLFGLSAFMVEKRTKEIGIRKIMGASVGNLWRLISVDFAKLLLLACVIAIPVASYLISSWLNHYEYRADLSWWMYVFAVLGGFSVTMVTVSFHAFKASYTNPVEALRAE